MAENSQNHNMVEMKMEAMKKVFAEMILNTSKEAAARIMDAERKSLSFQKQLSTLKDESLRMLLRLKDHFISQIQEGEARSMNQKMKIEELEAQLSEAEEIIVNLRYELTQAQENVEILRHHQMRPMNGQSPQLDEPVHGCLLQINALDSSTGSQVVKFLPQDCETKTTSQHLTIQDKMSFDGTGGYNLSVKSLLNQFSAANGVSPMIVQTTENDQCRNGFIEKICTSEGNLSTISPCSSKPKHHQLLEYDLSNTGKKDLRNKQYPLTEKASMIGTNDESCEEPCSVSPSDTGGTDVKKTPTQFKRQIPYSSGCGKDPGIRSLRRSSGRSAKYREAIASLQSKPRKKYESSWENLSLGQLMACSNGVTEKSVEIPSKVVEKESKKTGFCCESGSDNGSPMSDIMNSCNYVFSGANLRSLVSSEELDAAENGEMLKIKGLPADNPLKLTLHKKRRKKALRKIDENIFHDKNFVKRKLEKSANALIESHGPKADAQG